MKKDEQLVDILKSDIKKNKLEKARKQLIINAKDLRQQWKLAFKNYVEKVELATDDVNQEDVAYDALVDCETKAKTMENFMSQNNIKEDDL